MHRNEHDAHRAMQDNAADIRRLQLDRAYKAAPLTLIEKVGIVMFTAACVLVGVSVLFWLGVLA